MSATNYNSTKVATLATFEAGTALPSDVLSAISGYGTKLRVITDSLTVATALDASESDTVTIGTLPIGAMPIAVLVSCTTAGGSGVFTSNITAAASTMAIATAGATAIAYANNAGVALTAETDVVLTLATADVAVGKILNFAIVYADTKG